MLKEFVERQSLLPSPVDAAEKVRRIQDTFDAFVDFLRDPDSFPNTEINQVVTLMWRLIGNREIQMGLDDEGRVSSVSFTVLVSRDDDKDKRPILIIPGNFLGQTVSDPVLQLGMMGFMASQVKDFYMGAIEKGTSQDVNRRARAYEAEVLLTLSGMAQSEGMQLPLNDYQQKVLGENPQGLKSLPSGFFTLTPVYSSPRGF